jgi:uncharacterized protein YjeT (DUF2065 family)
MRDDEIMDVVIRVWGTAIMVIGVVIGWQLHSVFR